MAMRGETWRFWTPVLLLLAMAVYAGQKLVRSHVDPKVTAPTYDFERELPARRGTIYSAYGERYPLVKSVPFWEYSLDPFALTNAVVRRRGEPRRTKYAIVRTIADALGADYGKLKRMVDAPPRSGWRSQPLGLSSDPEVHRILADSSLVAGVAIHDRQVRQYLHGRRLSHVLGSVNADHVGSAGIEQRFNRELSGTPGMIRGRKDARKYEIYDKRTISIDPVPGADVYLTIDHNIQFEAESALKWGLSEYGAGTGWCIVMDARTAAVLAMASLPDFEPLAYGRATEDQQLNRAIAFNYEPGSVMKVITAATAIDAFPRRYGPGTVFRTNRDDPNYYKLPGDAGHVWPATMTLKDAIVKSSNIVIGKLAYDLGPAVLHDGMKKFGFGEKTGIELPGEQYGILPNPHKRTWDKASQSRAGIGQFVAVTAIQLASAYQAIANDGVRMRPHIVEKVVAVDGRELYHWDETPAGRAISAESARTMREMMLGVASKDGTARRAAIRGYSVAGKTGTAQKSIPGGRGYYPGQYRATFCGIVPASDPHLVVLVTLDFNHNTKFHQGGNSSGPVFKRIALAALRYLSVSPDRPEELQDFEDDDEYDRILDERDGKYAPAAD